MCRRQSTVVRAASVGCSFLDARFEIRYALAQRLISPLHLRFGLGFLGFLLLLGSQLPFMLFKPRRTERAQFFECVLCHVADDGSITLRSRAPVSVNPLQTDSVEQGNGNGPTWECRWHRLRWGSVKFRAESWVHVFDEFARKLTANCRVYGITQRGFGMRSQVNEWCERNHFWRALRSSSVRFNCSSFCPASPSLPSAVRRW
jgi:hypothetical protein